jgi:hypothetical protein
VLTVKENFSAFSAKLKKKQLELEALRWSRSVELDIVELAKQIQPDFPWENAKLSFAVEVGVALKTNLTEHLAKLRAASDRVDRLCAKAVEEAEEVQAMLRRRVALERQLADARQQLADWTREARGRPHPSVDAMQKRIRGIDDALARSSDDLAGRVRRSLDTRKALEEAGSALDDISRGGRGRIARMATKALASRTAKIAAKALAKLIPVLNIVSLAMDLVELIELATLLARIVKQSSDAAGEDGEGGDRPRRRRPFRSGATRRWGPSGRRRTMSSTRRSRCTRRRGRRSTRWPLTIPSSGCPLPTGSA